MEFNEKTGDLVGLHQINPDDDILLITNTGMTIRITAESVRKISRTSMGVRMMKLRSTNKIVDVAVVPAEDKDLTADEPQTPEEQTTQVEQPEQSN